MFFKRKPNANQDEGGAGLTAVDAPVSDALILICEKCGKKLASDAEDNLSKRLQSELKDRIKSQYGKGKVRSVLTSCMDVCPKGEIAVAISRLSPFTGQNADQFFTLQDSDLKGAVDVLLDKATR